MTTRNMPTLSLRAAFQPGTVDVERRTVDLVWTTGARVLRSSWFDGQFYEELSLDPKHVRMDRLNNGAPFLANHNQWDVSRVMGVVESARLEGNRGVATVRFAKAEDDPEADKLFRKIKDGIVQNVSVGYRTFKFEKVEGGETEIPVFRATDWEPHEISAVAMGADDGAGFRHSPELNECIFVSPEESRKMADEKNPGSEAPASDSEATRAAALKVQTEATIAERERVTGIRHAVRAARLDEKVADDLISDGTALDKARALVLEKLASESDAVKTDQRVTVTEDNRDKFVRGATAWLVEKSGARDLVKRAADKGAYAAVETNGGEFRGMTLVDLARHCLERQGVSTRGMDKMTMVGRALTYRSGGYATTSDFAVLFENVMHKLLLGAYATVPDTWSLFCGVKEVSDFRLHNFFRTGSFGALDEVSEHGEFKNKAIPDGQKSSVSVGTRGNIIALSRQAIINDDMGALSDLAQKLGRGARLSIELEVYTQLLLNSGLGPTQSDSQPFFHSNRANVNASASAITSAGIDADRVVMASQRDISSNDYLDLRPAVLLVPIGKGTDAKVLNDAQFDPESNKFQKPNAVRGLFRTIVDTPRLTGTRRYLFADPGIAPAIVVSFLEGQGQGPVMETQDGWRVDGTEWKIRMDFGVDFFDPKGAVTNAGA